MFELPSFLSELRDDLEYDALRATLTALFTAGAAKSRGRATHRVGVGGRGVLRVSDGFALPAHEVWQPGRRFDVVLRHANLLEEDDLAADYRGAALKISDADGHVADLLMNTGEVTVWSHAAMFAERMMLSMRKKLPEFYARHPDALPRYWGGLRRAPAGYDTLRYHSKLSGMYIAADGTRYTCRYRLTPRDYKGEDTGLPTRRDHDAGVDFTARWSEETRPKDCLRRAYTERLKAGPIVYDLAIALGDAPLDWRDPIYDASRAWDTAAHPWVELAEVRVERALEHAELEPLRFDIAHVPDCLGVFPADAATDFTSIGDLRAALYSVAAAARPD